MTVKWNQSINFNYLLCDAKRRMVKFHEIR